MWTLVALMIQCLDTVYYYTSHDSAWQPLILAAAISGSVRPRGSRSQPEPERLCHDHDAPRRPNQQCRRKFLGLGP
eukprot:19717-Rhodomonas_salina.5